MVSELYDSSPKMSRSENDTINSLWFYASERYMIQIRDIPDVLDIGSEPRILREYDIFAFYDL